MNEDVCVCVYVVFSLCVTFEQKDAIAGKEKKIIRNVVRNQFDCSKLSEPVIVTKEEKTIVYDVLCTMHVDLNLARFVSC